MKKEFQNKHNKLRQEVASQIGLLIHNHGQESASMNEKVLKLNDEHMFNLENGSYVKEISTTVLIDNNGYHHFYDCLTLEQLCEIADSFE